MVVFSKAAIPVLNVPSSFLLLPNFQAFLTVSLLLVPEPYHTSLTGSHYGSAFVVLSPYPGHSLRMSLLCPQESLVQCMRQSWERSFNHRLGMTIQLFWTLLSTTPSTVDNPENAEAKTIIKQAARPFQASKLS